VSGAAGWLLWGLAHLAFMPARENRLTLLTKWLWMIVVRQRSALVINEAVSGERPAAA
jgi:NADH dehydrogenase